MKRKMFYKKDYVKELLKIIRTETDTTKLPKLLSDYHEKDIAEAITLLSETERRQLYPVLGAQKVAEIFSYLDDSEKYIEELPIEKAAKVVSYMDADDALDVLDDLTEHKKQELAYPQRKWWKYCHVHQPVERVHAWLREWTICLKYRQNCWSCSCRFHLHHRRAVCGHPSVHLRPDG